MSTEISTRRSSQRTLPASSYQEYEPLQQIIYRAVATDADPSSSSSGILRYQINSTNPSDASLYFTISSTTGDIYVAQTLAANNSLASNNAQDQALLSIVAKDISNSPKAALMTLNITIVRNQRAPVFTMSPYNGSATDTSPLGFIVANVSARDPDMDNIYNNGTPNAQVVYSIKPGVDARYFDVSQGGNVVVAQPLPTKNTTTELVFDVLACDNGWNKKCSEARVNMSLSHQVIQAGNLGFKQPIYYLDLRENQPIGDLMEMDVENQGESRIACEIISQKENPPLFSVEWDQFSKNCKLTLLKGLDYETQTSYNVTVQVSKSISQTRRKRQIYVYNTFNPAVVIVKVLDVNEHSPVFQYPLYPRQASDTKNYYFGAISSQARPDRSVLEIFATDLDASAEFGTVIYTVDPPNTNLPFNLDINEGLISTTQEFLGNDQVQRQFTFDVKAEDTARRLSERRAVTGTVHINLIYPHNRFVLVLDGTNTEEVACKTGSNKTVTIQTASGKVALIESIERRRNLQDSNSLVIDNTGLFPEARVTDLIGILRSNANLSAEVIRTPYEGASIVSLRLGKSYVWWLDDPWAALIAIAAISILLCLVGIIVLTFTHSRYIKYVEAYRVHVQNYDQPEFLEPPSFLREYETQSLQMYVPPDEAVQDLGEINMVFDEGNLTAQHTGAGEEVTSAVNPIYQE
ncbi:hypothetical protein FSP39_013220 [Pinctada imbricata]|uniref:Cadherin domain-containing protein n=1 Tax=Pinctada imbricata TaxID=66713 RepID=A0AA88XYT2_PINIB|nr:hypothetical protein FSP39_013220 [Pinctada imbricata]